MVSVVGRTVGLSFKEDAVSVLAFDAVRSAFLRGPLFYTGEREVAAVVVTGGISHFQEDLLGSGISDGVCDTRIKFLLLGEMIG